MQQNSLEDSIDYIMGDASFLDSCQRTSVKTIFNEEIIAFLDDLSKELLSDRDAKGYSDIVTFAFWIRRASISRYREQYEKKMEQLCVGRGTVFHVAPSNVAMNFAYSLVVGLLAGNINIVRISSKEFPQTDIVVRAMEKTMEKHPEIRDYICLVKYGHDVRINDLLSGLSDVRIVWGGDDTIALFRQSPLRPRATEILFSNRYSLAVIDSDTYLAADDKARIASDFYNDTYLMDQNACSSPRMVIWVGKEIGKAKELFWNELHKVVSARYDYQDIQGMDKYLDSCLAAIDLDDAKIEPTGDNLITRISLKELSKDVVDHFGNSGFFLEYDASDISEIRDVCDDTRCQTISFIGDIKSLENLGLSSLKGIDRIVPVGKSMDFDLIWDGYDLITHLSRIISIKTK